MKAERVAEPPPHTSIGMAEPLLQPLPVLGVAEPSQ